MIVVFENLECLFGRLKVDYAFVLTQHENAVVEVGRLQGGHAAKIARAFLRGHVCLGFCVVGGDLDEILDVGGKQRLSGLYNGVKAPRLIENSKLTFTSSSDSIAEVSAAGVVTAKAAGTANIEVVVTDTDYSSLNAMGVVTVTTE